MKPETQRIHTPCTACVLHEHCYTVGMNPVGNDNAPLKIFLDCPPREDDQRHKFGESNIAKFVQWMLLRNSLKEEDGHYQIAFTLKCNIPKNFLAKNEQKDECIDACAPFRFASLQNAKAVLTMGEISCRAFLNRPLKNTVNCYWKSAEPHGLPIYVAYAPGYAIQTPSESVSIARMMWYAADRAGLTPAFNSKAGFFDYQII